MSTRVLRLSPAAITRIMRTTIGNEAFVALLDSDNADIRAWRYEFDRAKDMTYEQTAEGLQGLVDAGGLTAEQRAATLANWTTL